jgi:hypothetical protein
MITPAGGEDLGVSSWSYAASRRAFPLFWLSSKRK